MFSSKLFFSISATEVPFCKEIKSADLFSIIFLKYFISIELFSTLGFNLLPCQFRPILTLSFTAINVSHSRSLLSLILRAVERTIII